MLHYWKASKQKLAYDTVSGAVVSLTSLEYKMIQAIKPPFSPLCPSSLRYELAKYDSADVEDAYGHIFTWISSGILFAEGDPQRPALRIGGPHGLTVADNVAQDIANLLNGRIPEFIVAADIPSQQASEIRALFH